MSMAVQPLQHISYFITPIHQGKLVKRNNILMVIKHRTEPKSQQPCSCFRCNFYIVLSLCFDFSFFLLNKNSHTKQASQNGRETVQKVLLNHFSISAGQHDRNS